MSFNKRVYNWAVKNQDNLIPVIFISTFFPKIFLKSILKNNTGKNILWKNKKACLTISFDCDYPEDAEAIPYTVKMLDKYSIRASYACVGRWIEEYPQKHKNIIDSGHEIINHTYSHPDNELLNPGRKFRYISREEKAEEIRKCHEICKNLLGYEPSGCRIPHFKKLFTDEIYGILKELGYKYSSSTWIMNTKTAGMPFEASGGIFEFPLSTCPKHPFTVFDTWHSFNSSRLFYRLFHKTEREYIRLFKILLDMGIETGSYINVYLDPKDVAEMRNFEEILEYVKDKKEYLEIAPYCDLIKELAEGEQVQVKKQLREKI